MASVSRVDDVGRQGANGTASLSGVRVTSDTRSVWEDWIAGVVCPGGGHADGICRVECWYGPVRKGDVAGRLVIVGFRRVANGPGGRRAYELARNGSVKGLPF